MDQVLTEAAKQIPNLAALIVLVVIFMKIMRDVVKDMRITFETISLNCQEFQRKLTEETHKVVNANSTALAKNTEMMGRNIQALGSNTRAVNQ